MKALKTTETYAVMSLGQIRQIARYAESSSVSMYGHSEQKACIVIRGSSVKMSGKIQFSPETMSGSGELVTIKWQE